MNVLSCVEELALRFDRADLFYGHGTDNPWDEAVYLVFTVLGITFSSDVDEAANKAIEKRELTAAEQQQITTLAEQRIRDRVPMAYLLHQAWFAGLPFYVDERVLIPRSPIAELILQQYQPLLAQPPARVLDLCTGSGCIGIATALVFPQAEVDLADISTDALAVARHNIGQHGLEARVRAVHSDLFDNLSGPYDLIVSNPPYVSAQEIAELPAEYQREPGLGLLSDDDGLAIPVKILRDAAACLSEHGVLVLELGYTWQLLAERYPQLPVVWLEFENGGEGVLAISRQELIRVVW
ncbi:MAG: 50S ribosomal protein L3 N(5)-glutamine methyltransferase [Gammaproteobacteria bacterium]|nr:50S ribosomal protein L3 N(5)-glutamine methyltransferase [Gammaproteobacteria bacterium]